MDNATRSKSDAPQTSPHTRVVGGKTDRYKGEGIYKDDPIVAASPDEAFRLFPVPAAASNAQFLNPNITGANHAVDDNRSYNLQTRPHPRITIGNANQYRGDGKHMQEPITVASQKDVDLAIQLRDKVKVSQQATAAASAAILSTQFPNSNITGGNQNVYNGRSRHISGAITFVYPVTPPYPMRPGWNAENVVFGDSNYYTDNAKHDERPILVKSPTTTHPPHLSTAADAPRADAQPSWYYDERGAAGNPSTVNGIYVHPHIDLESTGATSGQQAAFQNGLHTDPYNHNSTGSNSYKRSDGGNYYYDPRN
ncbi:hypothetical protein H0H92_006091 [Tricholoma furcatifolium]|nr:hypothetical protein H0H92_006091 [Tricholoma furcatifolium]